MTLQKFTSAQQTVINGLIRGEKFPSAELGSLSKNEIIVSGLRRRGLVEYNNGLKWTAKGQELFSAGAIVSTEK